MPRRVFTYMEGQGWDLFNFISSIGAIMMAIGVVLMVLNMLLSIKSKPVNCRDYWGDGRSLEWAIQTPIPFYNFKQLPLVRGFDPYWIEKHEGNPEGMTYAEPLGDIHMPNNSILPLIMSIGLFVAAFGALYHPDGVSWSIPVMVIGLGITVLAMITRSVKDDLGYHVHVDEILAIEEELYGKGGNK